MFIPLDNQDVEVVIERKPNKNIYFRVKEDLRLHITCNRFTSDQEIFGLITKNIKPLTKMYLKQKNTQEKNHHFYYLGKILTIVVDKNLKKPFIEDGFIFTPSKEEITKIYKKLAKQFFEKRITELVLLFDYVPEFDLKVRKMTTRWGVCNRTKKTVTLNQELIKKRLEIIDYVIIHELSHFKYPHHQASFWNEVAKYCPNHKALRKELKE